MNPANEANAKKTQNYFDQLEILPLSLLKLLLLVKLLIINCGFLVLLVLADKVVHVGFGLCELHLVHALAGVPVKESLTSEHDCELLPDPLEEILDGRGVPDEGGRHLQPPWGNVTHSRLDVVGDPLDKVGTVLVLHAQHLFVNLLHGHPSAEDRRYREVPAVLGVAGGHHVLGIKHLLGELGYGEGPVALAATGSEWGEAGHEEVEAGEGDHVDRQLPQVGVQLARESEAGGDPGHCEGD